MINYSEKLKTQAQLTSAITKEKKVISELQTTQNDLKTYTNIYISEISKTLTDKDVFKNMLLASLNTALLQIDINIQDLINLQNILDITLASNSSIEENITQYNTLFDKVDKNITIVKEMLQKTITSFEQFFAILHKDSDLSKEANENLLKAKQIILGIDEKKQKEKKTITTDTQKNVKEIKEITDKASSDLLCFFPKTDNDILAISTVQDTYKVLFNEEIATVCIEDDNFNFTLKTVGVQISNSENVLLISREGTGYFILTNMLIEVPSYITISKIARNKNFLEIRITNSCISVSITKNEITFSDELEQSQPINATSNKAQTYSVTPSGEVPLSENLVAFSQNNINTEPVLNELFGQPLSAQPIISEPIQATPVETIQSQTIQSVPSQVPAPQVATDNKTIDLMKDNDTLVISDNDEKIILPYKLAEVEKQFNKNKKKYSSVQELIQNEYIVSSENFKNPIKSRFREAYQLIKKKEHGHLKEALELGFELMFQSNLNPAVIAACKNLRELDIYLDCLDDNELDKFSCFNIVYDIPPTTGKKKK